MVALMPASREYVVVGHNCLNGVQDYACPAALPDAQLGAQMVRHGCLPDTMGPPEKDDHGLAVRQHKSPFMMVQTEPKPSRAGANFDQAEIV
jgi:hypothetical protein